MEKPFVPLDGQVALLAGRGLDVGDRAWAASALHRLNYYRVSGYARQFQLAPSRGDNRYREGSTLEHIVDLIDRDDRLRTLLLEALREIEIGVRSRFAHEAGRALGSGAFYLDDSAYLEITPGLAAHLAKMRRELMRPSLRTVARYRVGDDLSAVPIWVAIEHISFGALAKTMWYLKSPVPAQQTADGVAVQRKGFTSAVHSFAVLRNVCAHHGQLWHRSLDVMFGTLPKEKKREPAHAPASVYSGIVVAKRFLTGMKRSPHWSGRVDSLLDEDPTFREGILNPRPR